MKTREQIEFRINELYDEIVEWGPSIFPVQMKELQDEIRILKWVLNEPKKQERLNT